MADVARIAVKEEEGGDLGVQLLCLLHQEHVQLGPVPATVHITFFFRFKTTETFLAFMSAIQTCIS